MELYYYILIIWYAIVSKFSAYECHNPQPFTIAALYIVRHLLKYAQFSNIEHNNNNWNRIEIENSIFKY